MNNLFDFTGADETKEVTEQIFAGPAVRIERILSTGQTTDWYDQQEGEWVALLTGEADLAFADGRVQTLKAGDSLYLSPHQKHRVARTTAACGCACFLRRRKENINMVRPITKDDRAAFLIFARAFYASEAVAHPVPPAYHARTFEELMQNSPYAAGYMLEAAGKPVGYALTAQTYSQEAGGMVLWIEELFVLPEHRGKGLGSEFFTYVKEKLEPNYARLRLEVEPQNEAALRLYQKMGFTPLPYRQMVKELR